MSVNYFPISEYQIVNGKFSRDKFAASACGRLMSRRPLQRYTLSFPRTR